METLVLMPASFIEMSHIIFLTLYIIRANVTIPLKKLIWSAGLQMFILGLWDMLNFTILQRVGNEMLSYTLNLLVVGAYILWAYFYLLHNLPVEKTVLFFAFAMTMHYEILFMFVKWTIYSLLYGSAFTMNFIRSYLTVDFGGFYLVAHLLALFLTLPPTLWILNKKVRTVLNETSFKGNKSIFLLPLFFSLMILLFALSDDRSGGNNEWFRVGMLVVIIGSFHMYYVILDVLVKSEMVARDRILLQQADLQLSLQAEHFENISEHMEKIKILRHDYRHTLIVLKDMLNKNEYNKALEYLEQMVQSTMEEPDFNYCSHYTVNTMTRYYMNEAKKSGVSMKAQLSVPKDIWISPMDLCALFGNLMENALEASKARNNKDGFIFIKAFLEGDTFLVTVENNYEVEPLPLSQGFISQKRKTGEIGIGIASLKAIANYYAGTADFTLEQGIFKAVVTLHRLKGTKNESIVV